MFPVAGTPPYESAVRALAGLLGKQRAEFVFVGTVARAAHLGSQPIAAGSVDALALIGQQQKNQLAMMAANSGFAVDRDELEATEELDLVPMKFDGVRLHVLVASNALYGRMVNDGTTAAFGDLTIRVPRAEDLALLLQMSSDADALMELAASPGFDRAGFNRKLISIGLRELVISE